MKLLGKTILVSDFEPVDKPRGSIMLLDESLEKAGVVKATVVEVGLKATDQDLAKGDKVLVNNHWGTQIIIAGKQHKIYNYDDVHCKVI